MDDLARDPDQPVRHAIAVEDIARLEDRRGMLKGLSQAVVDTYAPEDPSADRCVQPRGTVSRSLAARFFSFAELESFARVLPSSSVSDNAGVNYSQACLAAVGA